MNVLARVRKEDYLPEHEAWIEKACKSAYTGVTSKHIIEELAEGSMMLWGFKITQGVFLVRVLIHPKGKELFVWGMAGKGIIKSHEEILKDLRDIAKAFECCWLGGNLTIPKYEKLYLRYSKKVSTQFLMEV